MMRFIISILFLLLLSNQSHSQITFNKVKHDFGDLQAYSPRYVDFILTNTGKKQEWLLSVNKPSEVVYINSKQIIEPDSSVIVRFQVNPKVKGRFNYTAEIFTSDRSEAVKIKLSGNLKEVDQNNTNAFTACPSFDDRPGRKVPNEFDVTVVTIDKETKIELSKTTVTLLQNGEPLWRKRTDKKGKIKEVATLGFSYFYATHEGYHHAELGAYINFNRNYIVLELEPKRTEVVPVPILVIEDTLVAEVEPEPEIILEIEDHMEEMDTSSIVADVPSSFTELDRDNFDEEYFKPINVVFVLDVSASMKQADKIELMKYSLFQLTNMIRPQDKIGIVTYASDAQVLLKPTTGANKTKIMEEVEKLKAYGFTAGGSGIKLGFKLAKRAKIENGTNHVIVITDGAFNRESDDYEQYVKRYKKKGIHMSVVGIKYKPNAEEEMRYAAELGGGHYVPIFQLVDAQHNLKQEIRLLTYKY
ncbi:MAG: VWA domain-containing protein [Crocinitomicaceae bacterium]|nr:VWA domain-containing protein [Crocinitomicaceae bacterium]